MQKGRPKTDINYTFENRHRHSQKLKVKTKKTKHYLHISEQANAEIPKHHEWPTSPVQAVHYQPTPTPIHAVSVSSRKNREWGRGRGGERLEVQ